MKELLNKILSKLEREDRPRIRFRRGDKLPLMMAIASIISASATYMVLSGTAAYARKLSALRAVTPESADFTFEAYSYEPATTKRNILLSVTDGEELCRVHVLTFDEDKHTLEILDIPPDTFVSCGGFEGTLAEAYETEVYAEIVSMALSLHLDGSMATSIETVSDSINLLGGVKLTLDKELKIGDNIISKGERTVLGSVARIILSDSASYSESDSDRISAYHQLLVSFISTLKEKGAVEWVSLTLNLIVNRVETDMAVSEIIELINLLNETQTENININLITIENSK
ncbi:MAG: LCP family protein [Oscillospiraceae bacterium]|nr:LCP family protein [Oscillospiraceae bacterium]